MWRGLTSRCVANEWQVFYIMVAVDQRLQDNLTDHWLAWLFIVQSPTIWWVLLSILLLPACRLLYCSMITTVLSIIYCLCITNLFSKYNTNTFLWRQQSTYGWFLDRGSYNKHHSAVCDILRKGSIQFTNVQFNGRDTIASLLWCHVFHVGCGVGYIDQFDSSIMVHRWRVIANTFERD